MPKKTFQHANDAAMGNLGYERNFADAYFTPTWCTEALLRELPKLVGGWRLLDDNWWEPACGNGAISRVFLTHQKKIDKGENRTVISSDLYDFGFGSCPVDFLQQDEMPKTPSFEACQSIVTNPPYKLAQKFVRHAIRLTASTRGIVCMLLRNEWDSAGTRNDLFTSNTFAGKVVLTSRPLWIEGSDGSPRHNYSWFVWDHRRPHQHPNCPPFITYAGK